MRELQETFGHLVFHRPSIMEPGATEGPLWRLEGDRLVAQGKPAALSNGLARSPDGRNIYHSHTMTDESSAWATTPRAIG